MKQTHYDMLYLCICALNGRAPERELIERLDLKKLFDASTAHSLTGLVAFALESAGVDTRGNEGADFVEARAKAMRKVILLEAEMKRICAFMEESAIEHMPLKGAILKDCYPKLGMRQMSDIDILYDGAHQKKLYEFMSTSGYKASDLERGICDDYRKPPILHFEMHRALFGQTANDVIFEYYSDVFARLVGVQGKLYSRRFTDEDFYIYMTAHEYKHYSNTGSDLRALFDTAMYLRKKGESLDFDYIVGELGKLGVAEFESKLRALAVKLTGGAGNTEAASDVCLLDADERELLDALLFSGVYGRVDKVTGRNFEKFAEKTGSRSKFRYILSRIFPDMEYYRIEYPFFYRHKPLLPICFFIRLYKALFVRRADIRAELDSVMKK